MANNLHLLIHSLTQSEKRYFKLQSHFIFPGEEKKFMQLFDIVLKQREYNEQSVKKELGTLYFAQRKQQLFTKILECLRAYQQGNTASTRIHDLVANYRILLNKSLMSSATNAIKKAETIALNYELFSELISIKQAETELLVALGDTKKLDKHINDLREYMPIWISRIDDFIKIEKAYFIFVKLNKENDFIRSESEQKKLDAFIVDIVSKDSDGLKTQKAKIYYHYIQGLYYFLSGKLRKSKEAFQQQVKTFEDNIFIKENELNEYAKALANYCLLSSKTEDETQFYLGLKKLNEIVTKNTLLNNQIRYWNYLLQLNFYVKKGEMQDALSWISKKQNRIEDFMFNKDLMLTEKNYVMFDTALVYMCNNQFSKANKLINEYLNNSDVESKSDHYDLARIIQLFVQFELGNEEYILNAVKSLERSLKQKNKLYNLEKACINFMESIISVSSNKERVKTWKNFHEELIQVNKKRFDRNALINFDLIYWVERKIK